jgi:integrase
VAYAERRGDYWRARWRGPDGTLESSPASLRFKTKKDAVAYGRDQEAAIRNNTYVDPRAGQITLLEWVNIWYPDQDLEPSTLANYKYLIEVHLLTEFGERELQSLTPEEIGAWERKIRANPAYKARTATDARSMLITVLEAAIPRYIQTNPAVRHKGRGRKGQRRIQEAERKEKVWAMPLQALLLAERCSVLSQVDTDFVAVVTLAYTGARWGEMVGLDPDEVKADVAGLKWKLYELNGKFYRGRPKDGSIREVDLPPFLSRLLQRHLATDGGRMCNCRHEEEPWCPGRRYVFLGPDGGHFRRSNYSERFMRPAADGWHPARNGKDARPSMPVLVDMSQAWPGTPLPPWPAAVPGEPFSVPTGRGRPRLFNDAEIGRCPHCGRSHRRRVDGTLINHRLGKGDETCPGSGQQPAADLAVATWLPLVPGLTPHGLRHAHQTWLEDADVHYFLISERMGHEIPGMRGTYGHVTPAMREEAMAVLQELWQESLRQRAALSPRSAVGVLDDLLREFREAT